MIHQRISSRQRLPILFLLIGLATSIAPAQQSSSSSKTKSSSSDVTLTERDNGADTDLPIGSALIVICPRTLRPDTAGRLSASLLL